MDSCMVYFFRFRSKLTVFALFLLVEHPWIQHAKKASNVPLGDIVRTRLKQFSLMNRFKKKALRVSFLKLLVIVNLYCYCLSDVFKRPIWTDTDPSPWGKRFSLHYLKKKNYEVKQ